MRILIFLEVKERKKRKVIDERRKNPGDDFLSTLILAEDQGSKLSNMEMCALVGAVLGAGSDTAVDLHSYLIKTLLQHPDQLNALKDDESLVQGAISETLRYESSGKTGLARYASEDIDLKQAKSLAPNINLEFISIKSLLTDDNSKAIFGILYFENNLIMVPLKILNKFK